MKKLLLAVGSGELKTETLDFACYLARLSHSRLTGIFHETLDCEEVIVTSMRDDALHMHTLKDTSMPENDVVRNKGEERIDRFKDACTAREVVPHIHRNRGMPWDELLTECRYADIIIADAGFSFNSEKAGAIPTHDLKKLLHEAECPVIVAPPGFAQVDEIVLTYDGSPSSVFAIRQFIHLFPEYSDTKVVVLEIRQDDENFVDEKYRLKEWLKNHFENIEHVLLQGDSEDRLLEYLLSRTNAFVVMGGYGRGRLSRLFQPSASATVLKLLSAPIFVSHP